MDPHHHLTASLRQLWELCWPALPESSSSSTSPSALQALIEHRGVVRQQLSSHTVSATASARADDVRASQLAPACCFKDAVEVGSGEAAERRELADLFAG
eukprot:6490888-Amphidinium_carterae.1